MLSVFAPRSHREISVCSPCLGDSGVKLLPPRYALGPMEHLDFDCLFLGPTLLAIFIRRAHEGAEQRMRLERLRLEFRMELASDEVRMVRQLHHLDIGPIGSRP